MADNYLEKKMEEHRNGGAPSYRRKYTPRGTRPGEWIVKFTPCDVRIPDCEPALLQQLAREMAGVGFRVSFTVADSRAGARFAQQTGCRFIPKSENSENSENSESSDNPASPLTVTMTSGGAVRLVLGNLVTELSADNSPDSSPLLLQNILLEAVNLVNFNRSSENMLGNIKIERKKL